MVCTFVKHTVINIAFYVIAQQLILNACIELSTIQGLQLRISITLADLILNLLIEDYQLYSGFHPAMKIWGEAQKVSGLV